MTDRSEDMELALEAFDGIITRAYVKCSFFGFVAGVLVGLCAAAMLAISIRG